MFENHRKSLIQHCERSEQRLQKLIKNVKNSPFWRVVRKPEAHGQIVLPDRSVLIGQKLVENAKIQKYKCDILSNFQTMCMSGGEEY